MILTSCQVVICCCGEAMISRDGDHHDLKKSASRDADDDDAAKKKVSAEASRPENSPEPQKRSREARMPRSPKARNSSSSRSAKARNSSSSSRKARRKRKRFLNSEHQRISFFWCFLILETSRSLSQHVLQLYFVPSLLLVVFHVLHFYKQTSSQLWPSFNFICCCLSFQLSVKTCQNHLPSDQGLISHCGVLTQASLVG